MGGGGKGLENFKRKKKESNIKYGKRDSNVNFRFSINWFVHTYGRNLLFLFIYMHIKNQNL